LISSIAGFFFGEKMKISLIALSTLILGILIGKFAFSTNEVIIRTETIPIKTQKDKQLDSLSEGFYNLSQTEFNEYIKLKDESKKAEKAEEILGKVMLLFLANVQMKMTTEVKDYFDKPKKVALDKKEKKTKESVLSKDEKKLEVYINEYKKAKPLGVKDSEFVDVERQMPIEIKSPYAYFKKAKPIKEYDKIQKFNGLFSGSMLVTAGKKKGQRHSVELNIAFSDDNGKINGSYESKLSFEGNTYSHNRGGGGNRQIRRASKGLYLVETSPNSFLHLRYLSDKDYFIGKYYDDDEYIGLVKLYPQAN
jgi:hypothetical protein